LHKSVQAIVREFVLGVKIEIDAGGGVWQAIRQINESLALEKLMAITASRDHLEATPRVVKYSLSNLCESRQWDVIVKFEVHLAICPTELIEIADNESAAPAPEPLVVSRITTSGEFEAGHDRARMLDELEKANNAIHAETIIPTMELDGVQRLAVARRRGNLLEMLSSNSALWLVADVGLQLEDVKKRGCPAEAN